MRRAMQFIQRCDSSCFMGKGGPHAVSEIGKRSIFKICGRCFGDSLCYKREIVYEGNVQSLAHFHSSIA